MEASNENRGLTRTKRIAIFVGIGVIAALALYFLGRSAGSSRVADIEQQHNATLAELSETEQRATRAENRSRMFQSLARLYRTALDLEERNFGTANRRLQEAASALQGVQSAENQQQIVQLRQDIAGTDLNVAVDLEDQRERILTFAERLHELIPQEQARPSSGAADTTADTTAVPAG